MQCWYIWKFLSDTLLALKTLPVDGLGRNLVRLESKCWRSGSCPPQPSTTTAARENWGGKCNKKSCKFDFCNFFHSIFPPKSQKLFWHFLSRGVVSFGFCQTWWATTLTGFLGPLRILTLLVKSSKKSYKVQEILWNLQKLQYCTKIRLQIARIEKMASEYCECF